MPSSRDFYYYSFITRFCQALFQYFCNLYFEPISCPPNGLNIAWFTIVCFDFFAKAVYMDSNCCGISHCIQAPYSFKQGFFIKYNIRIFCHKQKKVKFFVGQGRFCSSEINSPGVLINPKPVYLYYMVLFSFFLAGQPFKPANMRLDTRNQFCRTKRLYHIIICA